MYKRNKPTATTLLTNSGYTGETIEAKVRRIVNNKEPIRDGAPLIYTDRKDGVAPGHDIRTDRFEVAIDAMDKVQKTRIAQREQYIKERDKTNVGKAAAEGMKAEGGEAPVNTNDLKNN